MRVLRLVRAVGLILASVAMCSARIEADGDARVATKIHLTMPPAEEFCPKTLSFDGTLTIAQPLFHRSGTATYRWIRSDGATGPVTTMRLGPGDNVIHVSETWQLGANYGGWEALQVTSPYAYTSHHHDFMLTCPPPRPHH